MTASFVYITAKDKEEAATIGRSLVQERLAACINIIEGMTSMYWWEGKVQEESETVLIAKTDQDLVGRLIERVKSLHSYECPCVVTWPIAEGNAKYLQWIQDETSSL